ncbi:spermine synthase-like isoform X1 [Clavelina lepadiformis]|uniref:spermine synthase-like isoform X1 n=1 Tax=Clavelina lepadiformis TaxID=159417 RepID=UPI0040412ECA
MLVFTTLFEIRLKDQPEFFVEIWRIIENVLKRHKFSRSQASMTEELPPVCFLQNEGDPKTTALVTFADHFITIDFNEMSIDHDVTKHRLLAKNLQNELEDVLPLCAIKRTTPLQRGREIWQYSELGDGRIAEDDYAEILFDERSDYQQVTIARSEEYGNLLLLDGLVNLSENDDVYTRTLIGLDEGFRFDDQTILILGGGDGAALNQLLGQSPAMVTMVEIDDVVIRGCRTHLRGCCGESLDSYRGENYQIIIGDCIELLRHYVKEGRKFDYVISDITDIPIEEKSGPNKDKKSQVFFSDVNHSIWGFFRDVYELCLKVTNDSGYIMTHVGASSNKDLTESFKTEISKLDKNLATKYIHKHVPSFEERWTFCHIRKNGAVDKN